MWIGYFTIGGNEVGNSTRAIEYQRSSDCPILWITDDPCPGLPMAVGHQSYSSSGMTDAPWYDVDLPELSRGFLGAYVISVSNLEDSTLAATVQERTRGGGTVGRQRHGSRSMLFRVLLTATSLSSVDYGKSWLSAVVEGSACGLHGESCGVSDLEFFTECPPEMEPGESMASYNTRINAMRRVFHDVGCTSGVRVVQELEANDAVHVGRIVEFVMTAENPRVFSVPREIEIPPSQPTIVQDIVYNLVPYPSAEIESATSYVVATNYSVNPSLEVDAEGWSGAAVAVSGALPAPYASQARSTELSANGLASFRSRLLGNGSTETSGVAKLSVSHEVMVGALSSGGLSVSCTVWGALINVSGPSDLRSLTCSIDWLNGATVVDTTAVPSGGVNFNGTVFAVRGVAIPSGATVARVTVEGVAGWKSSATAGQNSDIHLYADALALTVP